MRLFVTRPSVELNDPPPVNELSATTTFESWSTDDSTQQGKQPVDIEKDLCELENQPTLNAEDSEIENGATSPLEGMPREIEGVAVQYQRPDVEAIIRTSIGKTRSDQHVIVLGCGPDRLMKMVRNTTASCIKGDGPSVELHCEQFGW